MTEFPFPHLGRSTEKENNVRRTTMSMLLLTIVGLLILPAQPSSAQTPERVARLEAEVIGFTRPDPNDPHSLGINRVQGESEFRQLQINGLLECDDNEIVQFQLAQAVGHNVAFRTDDDVTDGFGEVVATDDDRAFRAEAATAVRPGGLPTPAVVEVRINEGRFHRILNYVEVQMRLDVRVVVNDQVICEAEDHEIRIVFLIIGPSDQVTEGFTLVGVARTHELPGEDISLARTLCGVVNTVVDERVPDPLGSTTTPISPGRGNFHPCPPEGQQDT